MTVEFVPFDELSGDDLAAWKDLRSANPRLDSPYFHPDFTESIHQIWGDVVVVVARAENRAATWFMPLRIHRRVATPAGSPGADFHGPISAAGTVVDPIEILRAGALRSIVFDHLLDGTPGFDPWVTARRASPFADVSGGAEGYLGRASSTGRQNLQQARRRTRKAEGELGPIRFVADSDDVGLLDEVVRLKRGQYSATRARDYFAPPGRRELLDLILRRRDPDFSGMLSGLYFGDRLVAAHFGMRSLGVLHWWFPVYDPEVARLGPGWLLLRQLIEAAPELDLQRIDFGRGDDEYKRRAKTGEVTVCEGRVEAGAIRPFLHRAVRRGGTAVRSAPGGDVVVDLAKRVRQRLRR